MNFLRISCFFILFVLISCNSLDVKNQQNFSNVLSIVVYENDVKCIKNAFSTFVAQALDTIPEETCGYATYIVDFDVQSSNVPPFEANLISWDKLDTSTFKYMSGSILESSYKDTLLSIASISNLDHFMFISVTQNVPEDYIFNYKLVCPKDSVDSLGIVSMYLKAKELDPQGIDTIPVSRTSLIAFNILPFLEDQIKQGNDSLVQINLKFSYRTDSIGNPVYSSYKSNPVKIKLNP